MAAVKSRDELVGHVLVVLLGAFLHLHHVVVAIYFSQDSTTEPNVALLLALLNVVVARLDRFALSSSSSDTAQKVSCLNDLHQLERILLERLEIGVGLDFGERFCRQRSHEHTEQLFLLIGNLLLTIFVALVSGFELDHFDLVFGIIRLFRRFVLGLLEILDDAGEQTLSSVDVLDQAFLGPSIIIRRTRVLSKTKDGDLGRIFGRRCFESILRSVVAAEASGLLPRTTGSVHVLLLGR
mmetsp:Transcript_19602/g.32774  ORF Transcript_19602/g.32774 Transcript_19602/m.32774 type:complete len:239 (-) Transcript_19602:2437-3153(-)